MVKKTESSCTQKKVIRGAWTAEEDRILAEYVKTHGDKKWRSLPANAGLNRCGKSCRLRWMNYLRPGIKRGNISEDEEDLIIRLHNLIGNRWSLIAGRLPGRTDNEIKNHWNTHLSKRSLTINELNLKLNQKLPETTVDCSSSSCSTIFTADPNWAQQVSDPSPNHLGSDNVLFASNKPCENDLRTEMERFFEFPCESDEFGIRRDGDSFIGEGEEMLQNWLNDKVQESNGASLVNQQITYTQLDFDTLARLLEYEDDDLFLSF